MRDQEKFVGFKKRMIQENEEKYGQEMRERYGDDVVEKSNEKFMRMSEEEYQEATGIENQLKEELVKAIESGDPAGELAQKVAELHKQWLLYFWNDYSKEAHAGLAQMYVDDKRFAQYYDQVYPGAAKFLRDAIVVYTRVEKK